jgi:exopolysaccharide biosynthesis polyprenyl glycosylphosphotransferase
LESLFRDTRGLIVVADILAVSCSGAVVGSLALTLASVLWVVAWQAAGGFYRFRLSMSVLDELPKLSSRCLVSAALLIALAPALGSDPREAVWFAAVAGTLLLCARTVCYAAVRRLRAHGLISQPALIVGANHTGCHLARVLDEHPEYGLRPQGYVDGCRNHALDPQLPFLGETADMMRIAEAMNVRVAVLAEGDFADEALVGELRACLRQPFEIFVVPRLHELGYVHQDMELIWDTPVMRLHRLAHRSFGWRLKRVIDVGVATVALTLLLPVMAAVAVAVRLEGGRGVVFRQERVGLDGHRFHLLKFRSLRPVDDNESETLWNIAHDDRLGPVGRFLRRSSLDELPQLVNVLRGEMSLVGPRPERPYFVERYSGLYTGYGSRHRVPCGLTGWAQVHGLRGDTSIMERATFDNFYIENWSLWLDLKIVLKTGGCLLRWSGA